MTWCRQQQRNNIMSEFEHVHTDGNNGSQRDHGLYQCSEEVILHKNGYLSRSVPSPCALESQDDEAEAYARSVDEENDGNVGTTRKR